MRIKIEKTHLEAQGIQLSEMDGTAIRLEEMQLQTMNAEILADGSLHAMIQPGAAELTITEVDLNAAVKNINLAMVDQLQFSILSDKIRVHGRIMPGIKLPTGFTITGGLEIAGGTHLQLQTDEVKFIGMNMPSFLHKLVVPQLNEAIRKATDVTSSPVPLRLTELHCRPGRITLQAVIGPWQSPTDSISIISQNVPKEGL